jgi:hypothetical protein
MTLTEGMNTTQLSNFYTRITRVSLLYYNKDSCCDYGTKFNTWNILGSTDANHQTMCTFVDSYYEDRSYNFFSYVSTLTYLLNSRQLIQNFVVFNWI